MDLPSVMGISEMMAEKEQLKKKRGSVRDMDRFDRKCVTP